MKIIKKGHTAPKAYRFKCVWCGSVLEAEPDEMKPDVFGRNEQYYSFRCPVCNKDRIISERDWEEIGEG